MSYSTSRWIAAIGLAFAVASPAHAQYGVANLTFADGGVTRQHRGAPAATTIGVSIMDGDSIETTNGRAEVTFLDGTVVHLDRDSAVMVFASERVRMISGRVSLRTSGTRTYVAEAASAKLHVQTGTVIDMSAQAGASEATVRVISGKARLESASGSTQVPDYHSIRITAASYTPAVTKIVPGPADEFERWALNRLVMAASTPLKGTEFGGGVAYYPYGYYGYGYYPYSYSYTRYYYVPATTYYYVAPQYYTPYPYYSPGYYGSTYYASPNYYSSAPARSYYGANYNTASSYSTPATSRFTYSPSSIAPTPTITPGTTSTGAPLPSRPKS